MKRSTILVTGGNGYIARRVARKLLVDEEQTVALWVHAADSEEFKSTGKQLCNELCENPGRLRLYWGDLRSENPFDDIDSQDIGIILHTAAVTRFNVEQQIAQSINVEGTTKLLRFAEKCQNLQRVIMLSTVYASGLKEGALFEEPWDGKEGFSNFYEWSKWAGEQELLQHYSHLPWKILRVATIIADSDSGEVTQQNAFHNTLKLIYYGFLSILPGKADTPLYFVTGDFVTGAIYRSLQNNESARIYHVSHTKEESISLGQLVELVFEVFEEQKDFKEKRILKPLYSDQESFHLLVYAVHKFSGGIVNQAVSSVAPFSQQLYLNKDIRNTNLMCAVEDYKAPDASALIRNTARFLVRTRWGRK